ncbi:MAG: glycosyltransferase [Candidatus Cloacimonetes bacterium]|nr:glycosyltransferase [Candidatus Cloacimonadota bacterium]
MGNIHCTIGIIVYNEAENIGRLLQALEQQELEQVVIDRIIVVSSACHDGTDDIVREKMNHNERIELITEAERHGKSAAINKFLAVAKSEILIIESGDTIPAKDTIEKLVSVFADEKLGASGGRPVPENKRSGIVGHLVHILWEMHHLMALESPKLGEMIAFRNLVKSIPSHSAVDEASIEAIILDQGYKLVYVSDAVVYNKGPEKLDEYISQRRRIASGHLWLRENQRYEVASQDSGLLFRIMKKQFEHKPGEWFYLILAMKIEILCRFLGWWDLKILKKNPFKWDIAASSKNIKREI